MTVALPAVMDVEFYRGDGGAPNAEVDFGHDFTWGNVTEAKFYVRKAPGGDLLVAITKTLHPSRWVDNGDGTAYVRLMAADTDGKPDGLWWYDIELTSSQRTQTVQRGRFHLLGDIAGSTGGTVSLPVGGNALVYRDNPGLLNPQIQGVEVGSHHLVYWERIAPVSGVWAWSGTSGGNIDGVDDALAAVGQAWID